MMRLDVEGSSTIERPTPLNIKKTLRALRPASRTSYAALVDDDGRFLRVGGGRINCVLETGTSGGETFRAFSDDPSAFEDEPVNLTVGNAAVEVQPDEWFELTRVEAAFVAFLEGEDPRSLEGFEWRAHPGFSVEG